MSLGERLIKARENKNLTQSEAANLLGISNVVLNRYEKEERRPDPDTLKKLADLYECTSDYLLGRIDTPISDSVIEKYQEFWELISDVEKSNPLDVGNSNIIGKRIKKLREEKNLSREQLAGLIEVSPIKLTFYELGLLNPTSDILIELADILKTSTDYLLGRTEDSFFLEGVPFIEGENDDEEKALMLARIKFAMEGKKKK